MARRLVLDRSLNENLFAEAAGRNGWVFRAGPHDSDLSYERQWQTPDGGTIITFVADKLLGLRYVLVRGDARVAVEQQIRNTLPVIDRDYIRLRQRNAIDRDDQIMTVFYAAAFADDEFDPEIFAIFQKAMNDGNPDVRRAAAFATTYPAWTEFRDELMRLASQDPDPEVRHDAQVTLSSFEKHMWRKD